MHPQAIQRRQIAQVTRRPWVIGQVGDGGVGRTQRIVAKRMAPFGQVVLLATPVDFAAAMMDVEMIVLGERSFGIVSIPTLIRMKEAAGRDQDRADIAALLQVQATPDVDA